MMLFTMRRITADFKPKCLLPLKVLQSNSKVFSSGMQRRGPVVTPNKFPKRTLQPEAKPDIRFRIVGFPVTTPPNRWNAQLVGPFHIGWKYGQAGTAYPMTPIHLQQFPDKDSQRQSQDYLKLPLSGSGQRKLFLRSGKIFSHTASSWLT